MTVATKVRDDTEVTGNGRYWAANERFDAWLKAADKPIHVYGGKQFYLEGDPFEADRQVLVWLANEETHTDRYWQIGDFNISILLMTHKDVIPGSFTSHHGSCRTSLENELHGWSFRPTQAPAVGLREAVVGEVRYGPDPAFA
jgi:hypothetical protein